MIFKWIDISTCIEHLYLKVTNPLCNIVVESTTEGVEIVCGSAQLDYPLEIDTPCVKGLMVNFPRWSVGF